MNTPPRGENRQSICGGFCAADNQRISRLWAIEPQELNDGCPSHRPCPARDFLHPRWANNFGCKAPWELICVKLEGGHTQMGHRATQIGSHGLWKSLPTQVALTGAWILHYSKPGSNATHRSVAHLAPLDDL